MKCCDDSRKKPFTKYSLLNAGISVIRHYIDPTYDAFTTQETKEKRLEECNKCENLGEFFGKKQCKICMCFIEPKSSLVDQDCPHPNGSKWQKNPNE